MAEPLRLEIIVDDKGTPVVRQFTTAVQGMGQEVGKQTIGLQQAARAGDGFSVSLGSIVKGAAGFALITEGIGLLKGGITEALTSVVGFQSAMANANTLMIGQTALQQQLRGELLKLPPILGSSTELSRGLYEALSAGVKPAEAVQFVGVAATLAKAGLANLDTATVALTKTLQGYGMQTKDATQVSDILFQTVNLGQGSLQNFAAAFPMIIQQSVQLGVPLREAAATLATLSTAFPSAAEAATAYRGALNAVSENSAKFAAVGLDVKKIIGEEGVTGLFVKLAEVTGGSAQRLNEFIGRIEGQNAVLAITGPLLEKHRDNLRQMADTTGLSSKALAEQSVTLDAAFKILMATIDRWAQQTAPPILLFFSDVLNSLGNASGRVTSALDNTRAAMDRFIKGAESVPILGPILKAFDEYDASLTESIADLGQWSAGFVKAGSALDTFTSKTVASGEALAFAWERTDQVRSTLDDIEEKLLAGGMAWEFTSAGVAHFAAETAAATEAVKALRTKIAEDLNKDIGVLNSIVKDLRMGEVPKIIDPAIIEANVKAATAALGRLSQAGGISLLELRQSVTALEEALITRLGAVPPALQPIFDKIRAQGGQSAEGIAADFAMLKLKSQEHLQKMALDGMQAFDRLLQSGTLTPQQIVTVWQEKLKELREAGFESLPPLAEAINVQVRGAFEKTGTMLPQFFQPIAGAFKMLGLQTAQATADMATSQIAAFQDILRWGTGVPTELAERWLNTYDQIQRAGFDRLLPGMQQIWDQILAQASRTGQAIPIEILAAYDRIVTEGKQKIQAHANDIPNLVGEAWKDARRKKGEVFMGDFQIAAAVTIDVNSTDLAELESTLARLKNLQAQYFTFTPGGFGDEIALVMSRINELNASLRATQNEIAETEEAVRRLHKAELEAAKAEQALARKEAAYEAMRESIERTTTLWDGQIRQVTLFKDQLSLVLLAEEQRVDVLRTQETIASRMRDLAESRLNAEMAARGQTPETSKALLGLEIEKDRLELEEYRLEQAQQDTAEIARQIAVLGDRIDTERRGFQLLLNLRTDENALANVGLTIQHAKLTAEIDARELALLRNSEQISHQDRILEYLNAEKQIAEDIAAIRLDALERQASALGHVVAQLGAVMTVLRPGFDFRPTSGPGYTLAPTAERKPGPLLTMPRQHGGPVSLGRPYMVGERGPELFVPRQGGTIVPATGSGPQITVHAPITVSLLTATRLEAQKVADSLAEAINEGIRRGTIHGSLRAA